MTGLNSAAVIQAAQDHLASLGIFETVNGHEATSAPGGELTADVWMDLIRAVPEQSGLDITSALLTLWVRIYVPATTQPLDSIETTLAGAVDQVMGAYNAAFTFNGIVTYIDLLGAHGTPLTGQGGYVEIGGQPYRCMTIAVPCVIDDVWSQTP